MMLKLDPRLSGNEIGLPLPPTLWSLPAIYEQWSRRYRSRVSHSEYAAPTRWLLLFRLQRT